MTAPTPSQFSYRRKLIEVALPLEDINRESAREKSIRHGHPSTLHLWWARRPLAACRAVLFSQMVDDPSSLPEEFPTEADQAKERARLFDIIRNLVKWENTTKEEFLHPARVEIARSAARNHGVALPREMTPAEVADTLKRYAPPVLDPFAGGGSIPLEAQRLGLEAHASDLNPVAVLINKAMIEIPPKFAGQPSVNPESRTKYLSREWKGAEGLAEDVRYYGKWMRDEAFSRIGHLYPKVTLPKEQGGGEATVIAWLWARTVICPNPACGARMPLVRSFTLSTKKSKEVWIEPLVDRSTTPPTIKFAVQHGPGVPEGTVNRTGARCIACGSPVPFDYVRAEGKASRIGAQMMVIVVEGKGGRIYLPPTENQESTAARAHPTAVPDSDLPEQALGFRVQGYGMTKHRDLFTPRQLVALTTYSDLVRRAYELLLADTEGDAAYASAVATYLGLCVSRLSDTCNALCTWKASMTQVIHLFTRQAVSMRWDFAEPNVFGNAAGDFGVSLATLVKAVDTLPARGEAIVSHSDAATITDASQPMVSTDPPYYDNVPYADLSDFFYVWLRTALRDVYPQLLGTLLVPKTQELVAEPFRHGGKDQAQAFFEEGLRRTFLRLHDSQTTDYPIVVYYAFKQSEAEDNEAYDSRYVAVTASTGWETMLEGLLGSGFSVTGTWPVNTELGNRSRGLDSNALASSIVLVCRPRPSDATVVTRRDFLNALKRELPAALRDLQRGNIAPVDLAQASIGPGMAIFSRYGKVLEADGSPMRVRTALQLINQTLDETLAEQEGEFDSDTRFAITWFEQYGMGQGAFGDADVLARAKDTSVGGLAEAGVLEAKGGKVRLLRRDELPEKWNPHLDPRLSVWKVTQRLIQTLMDGAGTQGAAQLLDAVGGDYGEKARDLAYRLFTTSERRKWTQDAFAYNTLVTEWHDITGGVEVVRQHERAIPQQATLLNS